VPPLVNRVPVGGGGKYAVGAQGGSADAAIASHTHTANHAHGNTGDADINHHHNVNAHSHTVDIWSSYDGAHVHTVPVEGSRGYVVSGTNPNGGPAGISNVDGDKYGLATHFSEAQPATHRHAVNGSSGNTGGGTGWMNLNNIHAHTTPAWNGSTGATGVAAGEANMPPYVGMAFLIRAA
jgi:hypothetical protein